MNEKIKLLEQQCWESPQCEYTPSWFNSTKFAELIIRECIGIVEPTQHHQAFAQGYLGDIEGLELLVNKVKQIRKHFGVKE